MEKKVLIILSTAEKDKAMTGILYATNALKNEWLSEVKLCFFGPFEKLLAEDEEVQKYVDELANLQPPVACKFISDNQGVTEKLTLLGIETQYVGKLVSDYINEGYVPLVF